MSSYCSTVCTKTSLDRGVATVQQYVLSCKFNVSFPSYAIKHAPSKSNNSSQRRICIRPVFGTNIIYYQCWSVVVTEDSQYMADELWFVAADRGLTVLDTFLLE